MSKLGTYLYTAEISRRRSKRVETTSNGGVGWTSIPDGMEYGIAHVEIDVSAIVNQLGMKALQNKSGKAIALGGCVKVKISDRRRAP